MSVFNKLLDAVKMSDDDFEDDGFLDDDFDDEEEEIKEEKPKKRFFKKLEEEDEAEELEEEPIVERRASKKKAEKKQPEKKTTEKTSFYSRNTKNTKTTESSSKVTPMRATKRPSVPAAMEVCVIKPNNMEETREIADTLIAGCTVVLNLEGIDVSVAQRIIDFSSGTCYAMGGSLQKVSDYIFILTPSSVGITGDFQEILDGAFMSSIQTEY